MNMAIIVDILYRLLCFSFNIMHQSCSRQPMIGRAGDVSCLVYKLGYGLWSVVACGLVRI